ncbi:hypothetical protein [Rhodoferax aquaticus]|uniref:HTH iclR-type domain-containing protein n=1 Tax=Rhodoferax aquaticus TaxID=2527691 RepID=A0A515EV10_9BURK|nr:hypothetical protein [Rhodoferax aquaticus]QDL56506.1 hypothetical protein EXZ61_21405 [Rhodoferax aquaticus]
MPGSFDEQFERSFGAVAFIANRHMMDHMRRLSVEMEMDFESVYVWGLVAHLGAIKYFGTGRDSAQETPVNSVPQEALQGVRLSDLTAISGLPRETLRRKLEALQASKRLLRDDKGLWVLHPDGIEERTKEFTKETVRRLLNAARDIEQLLSRS